MSQYKSYDSVLEDLRDTKVSNGLQKMEGYNIIVIDNGFVFTGLCSVHGDENKTVLVQDAINLRSWGTKKGLGQLKSGPTSESQFDYFGTLVIPANRVVFTMPVDEEKWRKAKI